MFGKAAHRVDPPHQRSSENLILLPFPRTKAQSFFNWACSLVMAFQRPTPKLPFGSLVNDLCAIFGADVGLLDGVLLNCESLDPISQQISVKEIKIYGAQTPFTLALANSLPINKMKFSRIRVSPPQRKSL